MGLLEEIQVLRVVEDSFEMKRGNGFVVLQGGSESPLASLWSYGV